MSDHITYPLTPGNYYSWTIVSDEVAIKHMDKSTFDHHGSGIPEEISSFFVPDFKIGEKRIDLQLYDDDFTYNAHIKNDQHDRYQIHWQVDLVNVIHQLFDYHPALVVKEYPYMKFQKTGDFEYKISFSGVMIYDDMVPKEDARKIDDDILKSLLNRKNDSEIQEIVEQMFIDEGMPVLKRAYIAKSLSRNKELAELVKRRVEFRCELCGVEGFIQSSGKRYAEAHHLLELSQMEDQIRFEHPDLMICVCPTCHRKIHYGSPEEIQKLQEMRDSIKL